MQHLTQTVVPEVSQNGTEDEVQLSGEYYLTVLNTAAVMVSEYTETRDSL